MSTQAIPAPATQQPTATVIDTSSGQRDGLNKCPRCGSTEIATQPGTGRLQCHHCRYVFEEEAPMAFADPKELVGEFIGSGAGNITADSSQVTIKCQGCGAEVVVNTAESMTSRCHWCRQVLSVENQIPNGAVPDVLLPFKLSKEQARENIEAFVKKRTFYANSQFKKEFTTENIIGVFLPYMVVDANLHCDIRGKAGHITRKYSVGTGNNKRTVYDIDVYDIGRDFDLAIDNLTVEASSDKLTVSNKVNTNNIINTILPFDIENAIPYNGNYLKGFNSERRDTNIDDLRGLVNAQIRDVSRFSANRTARKYDAGIKWESEDINTKGTQWVAAYLPVWLYSYMQVKGDGKKLLHYIAVNARTGETMGSVPLSIPRLLLVSFAIELVALVVAILIIVAVLL
ncbi:MAG TPA: hypothetical protein DEB24_03100 [Coriobacteriia bacterium]|nr:hypothetical protein [Coriobacteriia bacterium]